MNLHKTSKILLFCCGLILIIVGVPRLVLQTWLPYSNYLFYSCLALFALSILFNYRYILSFFTMKTTKYGLNMGTMVLLGTVLFVGANFLGARYDKSVDITSEGLNSLSLQSKEVLDNLESKISFVVYHQGDVHKNQNIAYKLLFKKYLRETEKIETEFVDAHKDPSSKDLLESSDRGKTVLFVKRGDKLERVKEPIDEDTLTSAIYRLTKSSRKKIYFITGHGEREKNANQEGSSISTLVEELNEKGFETSTLNFLDIKKIPDDASMVALIGPKKSLLDYEAAMLKDYISEKSGRVFVSIDSGSEFETANVFNEYGFDFKKNYILTTQPVAGGDALHIAAQDFNEESLITSKLKNNAITLFNEASELEILESTGSQIQVSPLVTSLPTMIPVSDLKNYKAEVEGQNPKAVLLGLLSEGEADHTKHDHEEKPLNENENTTFKVIAFGDSDFMTDLYINTGFNKDLALSSFAYLTGEEDLISIQPKEASNTQLILTSTYSAFIIIFPILIPLISLIFSSILWFRKRSA